MIFACRIKDGQVNFSNQYVQTNRLKQEKKAGHPLGLKVALQTSKVAKHKSSIVQALCHASKTELALQDPAEMCCALSHVINSHVLLHTGAASVRMGCILQIGDCRGFVGLVELLWHQLEIKLGVYNVKVSSNHLVMCYAYMSHLVLHGDMPPDKVNTLVQRLAELCKTDSVCWCKCKSCACMLNDADGHKQTNANHHVLVAISSQDVYSCPCRNV